MDKTKVMDLYHRMVKMRKFEEKAGAIFAQGQLAGFLHLYIGEEAVGAGVCGALNDDDYIVSTHRGHGHLIAKGGDVNKIMAELFGKSTGYCKGKGGSMHVADFQKGMLGACGIVGGGIPIGVGAALTIKLRHTSQVAVCFFGDGASNEGTFLEVLNMAALWKLPVVFFCENNGYGVSTAVERASCTEHIAERAAGFQVPWKIVDGNDPLEVYEAVREAAQYARSGNGPTLVEAKTFRHQGHYSGDPAAYRPASYLEEAERKDAVARMQKRLMESGVSQDEIERMDQMIADEIEAAFEFAMESEYPDVSEAVTDVYAVDNERGVIR